VTFDTIGSTFDTLLAVYIGNSVNGLTVVASNNDIASNNAQSRVTFPAVATAQYHVVIDGYDGASGNTTLNWLLTRSLLLQVPAPTSSSLKEVAGEGERPTLSYNFLPAGEYQLTITGEPLRRYTVEVSSNLVEWTPLATTLADSAGTSYFRDKATVHAFHEAADKIKTAEPIESLLYDPVCGVLGTGAGAAGAGESRFYRVVEVP